MSSLSSLTSTQIQSIAGALSGTTTQPPGTVTDGAALYTTYCAGCHGALATSSKQGATLARIQSAIGSVSSMRSLSSLTSTQLQAIASALSGGTTTPPPTSGDGASLYGTYCAGCHNALASSQVRGSSASSIQSAIRSVGQMRSLSTLTSTQIQSIATALQSSSGGGSSSGGRGGRGGD